MWCSYHKTTTHSDADCRARRRKRADGNVHIVVTGTSRVKGICSTYDLPEEDDQLERPNIFLTATEVHPTAATPAEQSHKVETWPFRSLSASRRWPFEERAEPPISFGGQEKPDFSYMYGGTDAEGEPLYGLAPTESKPAEIERKQHERGNVATVLVDSGASGQYFDDLVIPKLKHCLRDYTSLSTPRTILTAGGALLDGSAEGVLQGLIADDYREQHLARIAILIVSGIGRNLFLVKTAARKGVVSIFDANKPRLEASDITVPLRGEIDDLYSFKCGWIRRKGAGDECGGQRPSVAPATGSPQRAQPHEQEERQWGCI